MTANCLQMCNSIFLFVWFTDLYNNDFYFCLNLRLIFIETQRGQRVELNFDIKILDHSPL